MSMRQLCLLPLIAALAACAHQGVGGTLPPVAPPVSSYVGIGIESLPAKAVPDYMAQEYSALSKTLAEGGSKAWQLSQLKDGSILLQAAAAVGFDTDSAELRPSALDACARIARIAQGFNKTMVHVSVSGRGATPAEFSQSLSDRRAAALSAYLGVQGIDDMHLRYEGSTSAKSDSVQILIRPIITGAEPQAWMSPS